MNNRNMSWVFASILLIIFLAYMTGYFYGKKKAVQELGFLERKEIFFDSSIPISNEIENSITHSSETDVVKNLVKIEQKCEDIYNVSTELQISDANKQESEQKTCRYYAPLIGFGTEKAAEKFVLRLQKEQLPVKMKKRKSSTAKGKIMYWYQVVTETFEDRHELENLVAKITKKERLSDTTIITC